MGLEERGQRARSSPGYFATHKDAVPPSTA